MSAISSGHWPTACAFRILVWRSLVVIAGYQTLTDRDAPEY